jgi:hypothetical protein
MAVDPLSLFSGKLFDRALDPMDRISEVLFSLIMALTFTCALDVVSAGKIEVRTMLFGVLGCNLSWGIIDGVLFLMARFNGRARNIMKLQALRKAVTSKPPIASSQKRCRHCWHRCCSRVNWN